MRKPTRDESEDVQEGLVEIEQQKEAERLEDLRYQAEMFDREDEYENFSFYNDQKDRFNHFDDTDFDDFGSDFEDDLLDSYSYHHREDLIS